MPPNEMLIALTRPKGVSLLLAAPQRTRLGIVLTEWS